MHQDTVITKLIFVPTGQYRDMGLRPYQLHATSDLLDRLETSTTGFTNLSRTAFAPIAGSILRPSTHTVGTLSIPNGWNSVRYIFYMEVRENRTDYSGEAIAERVTHITGYTDREGDPSFSGYLDPRMRMTITRVIHTRESTNQMGLRRNRFVDASLLLQRNAGQQGSMSSFYAMRPRDVCTNIGASGIRELGINGVNSDFRVSLAVRPLMSNIGNDMPTDYLHRVMNSYRSVANAAHHSDNAELPEVMDHVAAASGDDGAIDDPFVQSLHRHTEFCEGSMFQYGELCAMYPSLDRDVTKLLPPMNIKNDIGFQAANPSDSSDWGSSRTDTVAATILSSSVPAVLVHSMLTQVSFHATNDTINGEPRFEFLAEPESFVSNTNLSQNAAMFRDEFMFEVFRSITANNNLTVSIYVHCDIVESDMRINIDVDNQGPVDYTTPTFAQGLITPVIANDRSHLDTLGKNLQQVFDHMSPSKMGFPDEYKTGEYNGPADSSFRLGNGQPVSRIISGGGDTGGFKL